VTKFFLGTHMPHWLGLTKATLFVSDRRLRRYKTLPKAQGELAVDSGGFTELRDHGRWATTTAEAYIDRVRRYRDQIGGLAWAAQMDWMCEPAIIHGGRIAGQTFVGTGLTIGEHQHRTVANLHNLRTLASADDVRIAPVLQGWAVDDYLRCAELFISSGIDLSTEPVVGIGSVCRRQGTKEAAEIIAAVTAAIPGIQLHGFGVKVSGLRDYGSTLASADSLAWSYAARRSPALPGCSHTTCANCPRYAFQWRHRVLAALAGNLTHTPPQEGRRMAATQVHSTRHQRLALAAFRDEAARIERNATIRWAYQQSTPIDAIAKIMGLTPARVRQIIAQSDNRAPLDDVRDLRRRWDIDHDPASRACADQIVANLVELATSVPSDLNESYRVGEGPLAEAA